MGCFPEELLAILRGDIISSALAHQGKPALLRERIENVNLRRQMIVVSVGQAKGP